MNTNKRFAVTALAFLAMAGSAAALPPSTISEPDTTLYGRIVNRAGAAEEFVAEGVLTWSFQLPDGSEKTLSTRLELLHNGLYSYRLKIPHSLAASGLRTAPQAFPLALDPKAFGFVEILVNGAKAAVATDGVDGVTVSQAQRAQALRIDLELQEPMVDTDGDGMPDWWEQLYGLDPDAAGDALTDLDGDGLSNRDEFLAGLIPTEDNRQPRLAAREFMVYPAGRSGLALRVVDADTAPEDIAISVTQLPAIGQLVVRDGAGGRVLETGDQFMAADAERGLLEYRNTAEPGELPSRVTVGLVLSDQVGEPDGEEGATTPEPETLRLTFFQPTLDTDPAGDWQEVVDTAYHAAGESVTVSLRTKAALLARHGTSVVWDRIDALAGERLHALSGAATAEAYAADQEPLFGAESPVILLGGSGPDVLAGGFEDDILFGGAGKDRMTGNRGADRFVIDEHSGSEVITDFTPGEGDQIDLTRVIRGTSVVLEDYLRATVSAEGHAVLEMVPSGNPQEEPTVIVDLVDYPLTADALPVLVQSGALLVGNLSAMPLLSVERVSDAAENGLAAGSFLLRRAGSIQGALTVKLAVSGSATGGADYQAIGSSLTFPSNVREWVVPVIPYGDAVDEPEETIRIEILSGDGYRVAESGGAAELTIRDLEPMVALEVAREVIAVSPVATGLLMVNRDGLVDRQIVVRLRWSGAEALAALEQLPEFVELGKGETSRLIEIKPRPGIAAPERALSLAVQVIAGNNYLLGSSAAARLSVVPGTSSFGAWLVANGLDSGAQDIAQLAQADPDGQGLSLLARFAFGLAAQRPDAQSLALPQVRIRDGRPGLEFVLDPAAAGVQCKVETSADVRTWEAGDSRLRQIQHGPAAQTMPAGWRRYESTLTGAEQAETSRYFRVQLQLAP